MPRNQLNTSQPDVRQVWRHWISNIKLLIMDIDRETDEAVCCVLDAQDKPTKLYLLVSLDKFKFYGNRGMVLEGKRGGSLPKIDKDVNLGVYNPRLQNLGAK